MSDHPVGPGWWLASDGNWYPPADPVPGPADPPPTGLPVDLPPPADNIPWQPEAPTVATPTAVAAPAYAPPTAPPPTAPPPTAAAPAYQQPPPGYGPPPGPGFGASPPAGPPMAPPMAPVGAPAPTPWYRAPAAIVAMIAVAALIAVAAIVLIGGGDDGGVATGDTPRATDGGGGTIDTASPSDGDSPPDAEPLPGAEPIPGADPDAPVDAGTSELPTTGGGSTGIGLDLSRDQQDEVLELTWDGLGRSDRENLCDGVEIFGVDEAVALFNEGAENSFAPDLLAEKLRSWCRVN